MNNPRYVVKFNHCNCHPETCCCDKYHIVDTYTENKKVVATAFSKAQADDLVKLLNK